VVTGCLAQTRPEAVAAVGGVDLVVGNQEKYRLPDLLAGFAERRRTVAATPAVHVGSVARARTLPVVPLTRLTGRSRAFVKVQDGCQHRCAFCIVPAARGPSRSQEPAAVEAQVRGLVEAGHREVTLTGVDLGAWGRDLTPRSSLAALLGRLEAIAGLRWIRLSSVLPAYFTPDLFEVVTRSPRVAPHLHVPLQSGSDRVLRLMRRPYTAGMYRRLVERLARAVPDLGLGADVIVGHPGEREADFAETLALVRDLPLTYLHVFPYSDRKGTEAAGHGERVPPGAAAERSQALRDLAREKHRAFRERLVGRTVEALVLGAQDRETGLAVALTGPYVEVLVPGAQGLERRVVRVRVTRCQGERTWGELDGAGG
jgi:threonylcarbamoyladenosine tRNA methylthiotransferase MtaB